MDVQRQPRGLCATARCGLPGPLRAPEPHPFVRRSVRLVDDAGAGPTPAGADEDDPATNPIYVENAPHFLPAPPADERGETNLFQPTTGLHLQTLPLPPPWNAENGASPFGAAGDQGPALGWTVSSPGDLNGDGLRDFLAGAPFTNVCRIRLGTQNKYLNKNEGVMIVYRSGPPPSGGTEEDRAQSDKNPLDNVCNDDDGQGGPGQ
ncbi:MAG: integrin alpha [Actinomycetota bacterium]|nr:integrin alpha [Actinomycetota bacterium]